MSVNSIQDIWEEILRSLSSRLTPTAINTWFADSVPVSLEDYRLVIRTPSEFKKKIISDRFSASIKAVLSDLFSCDFELLILVGDEEYEPDEKATGTPVSERRICSGPSAIPSASISRRRKSPTSRATISQTSSSRPSRKGKPRISETSTAMPTCFCSTISSLSPASRAPRKSSFTPSTIFMRPGTRSSSPPTVPRWRCPCWTTVCAPALRAV